VINSSPPQIRPRFRVASLSMYIKRVAYPIGAGAAYVRHHPNHVGYVDIWSHCFSFQNPHIAGELHSWCHRGHLIFLKPLDRSTFDAFPHV